MSQMGGNQSVEEINRRAAQMTKLLNDISDLQEDVKKLRADLKAEGYDMKAFNQTVKEMRRGADYQAAQLELELVLDTYRKALKLPTTLEDAQKRAAEAAEKLPPPDDDGDANVSVHLAGGTKH